LGRLTVDTAITNVEYDEVTERWLLVIDGGKQVIDFSTEERACEAQRLCRFRNGQDEITGEKLA
jgi:hypothetical protein